MTEQCPNCKRDLTGEPIPEKYRDEYYGGKTHYSLLFSIYDQSKDRTVAWECSFCHYRAPSRSAFLTSLVRVQ